MDNHAFSAQDWIKRAESNFIPGTAFDFDNLPENLYIEDLCFQLQQCAEKAVKSVLINYSRKCAAVYKINQICSKNKISSLE